MDYIRAKIFIDVAGDYIITPVGSVSISAIHQTRTTPFTVTFSRGYYIYSGSRNTQFQRTSATGTAIGEPILASTLVQTLASAMPTGAYARLLTRDNEVLASTSTGGVATQAEANAAADWWSNAGAVNPGHTAIQTPKTTDWGAFNGCTATCGRDFALRVRQIIPAVHQSIATSNTAAKLVLEEEKICDKPCRVESSLLSDFNRLTRAKVTKLPDLMQLPTLMDTTVTPAKEINNPFHKNNLLYLKDDELAAQFEQWVISNKPVGGLEKYSPNDGWLNIDVYQSQLIAGSILPRDGIIINETYNQLLKYSGSNLQLCDEKGAVLVSYPIGQGDYVTIANSRLVAMTTPASTGTPTPVAYPSNSIFASMEISRLQLTKFGLMGFKTNAFTAPQVVLYFTSGDYELSLENNSAMTFTPTASVTFLKIDNVEFRWTPAVGFEILAGTESIWSLKASTMTIGGTEWSFTGTTSPATNLTLKSSSAVALKGIALSSAGRLELVDVNNAVVDYIGANYKSIPCDTTFLRPLRAFRFTSVTGAYSCNFQNDSNLVIYDTTKPGTVVWNSATSDPSGNGATHMRLEKTGEFAIWKGTTKVYSLTSPSGVTSCMGMIGETGSLLLTAIQQSETTPGAGAKMSIYQCQPNPYTSALDEYAGDMYNKAPAFALGTTPNEQTPITSPQIIIGLDEWMGTYNPDFCPPTNITCSWPTRGGIPSVDVSTDRWKQYGRIYNMANMTFTREWKMVDHLPLSYGIPTGYKRLWGYRASSATVKASEPRIIGVGLNDLTKPTEILMKLPEEDFKREYLAYAPAMNNFNSNPKPYVLMALRLNDTGVFDMHSAYTLTKPATLVGSRQSNLTTPPTDTMDTRTLKQIMLDERTDQLQDLCKGRVLDDECYLRLPRDQFFQESVARECAMPARADHPECLRTLVESYTPDQLREMMDKALADAGLTMEDITEKDGTLTSTLAGVRQGAGWWARAKATIHREAKNEDSPTRWIAMTIIIGIIICGLLRIAYTYWTPTHTQAQTHRSTSPPSETTQGA